jgi:hypothetical protein
MQGEGDRTQFFTNPQGLRESFGLSSHSGGICTKRRHQVDPRPGTAAKSSLDFLGRKPGLFGMTRTMPGRAKWGCLKAIHPEVRPGLNELVLLRALRLVSH